MRRIAFFTAATAYALSMSAQVETITITETITTTEERIIEIDDLGYNRLSLSYASYHYKCNRADDGIARGWWNGDVRQGDGFMVDYIRGFHISKTKPIFVESGLSFQANSQWNGWCVGLAVPLNITYKFNHKKGFYFTPYAGASLGIDLLDESINSVEGNYSYTHIIGNLDGTHFDQWQDEKWTGHVEGFNYHYHEGILTHKNIQIGYNIGANVGFNHWNCKVGYRANLTPTVSTDNDGNITTGTFYVGLGYNF